MVEFNVCSTDHVDTLDIQCWQLRGYIDEGQGNMGIGKTPTLRSRSMKAKVLTTIS